MHIPQRKVTACLDYSTAPHRTAPHGTAPHRTVPQRPAPPRTAPHCTARHSTTLRSPDLHALHPHRTAQHRALQRRALHSTAGPRPSAAGRGRAGACTRSPRGSPASRPACSAPARISSTYFFTSEVHIQGVVLNTAHYCVTVTEITYVISSEAPSCLSGSQELPQGRHFTASEPDETSHLFAWRWRTCSSWPGTVSHRGADARGRTRAGAEWYGTIWYSTV